MAEFTNGKDNYSTRLRRITVALLLLFFVSQQTLLSHAGDKTQSQRKNIHEDHCRDILDGEGAALPVLCIKDDFRFTFPDDRPQVEVDYQIIEINSYQRNVFYVLRSINAP